MNLEDKNLIWDLVVRPNGASKITKEEFLQRFSGKPDSDHEYVARLLDESSRLRDEDSLRCAIILGFNFGFLENSAAILSAILLESWHKQHESIVRVLQSLRFAGAVDSLYQAAITVYPYLESDKRFNLSVQCTWALYKIGTEDSTKKLIMISKSDNKVVAKAAKERLGNISIS